MQWLWELDQGLFRTIHLGWQRDWLDPVFWVVSSTGLGWVQASLIAIWAAGSWLSGSSDRVRAAFWHVTLTLLVSALVNTALLKNLIRRDRPSLLAISEPQETFFRGSFPSGHTATAFGIAFAVWLLTRGTRGAAWGWAALIWASLVGISRVYRGVHWPTDVVGAAAVGAICACLVWLALGRHRAACREALATTAEGDAAD